MATSSTTIKRRIVLSQSILLTLIIAAFAVVLENRLHATAVTEFQSKLASASTELASAIEFVAKTDTADLPPGLRKKKQKSGFLPPGHLRNLKKISVNDERLAAFAASYKADESMCYGVFDSKHVAIKSYNLPTDFDVAVQTTQSETHLSFLHSDGPKETTIVVGSSTAGLHDQRLAVISLLGLVGGILLAIGVLTSWLVANKIVRPLIRMSETAAKIRPGTPEVRLHADQAPAELDELCLAINGAFDRVDKLYLRERDFARNASHELRTPIAIIQCQSELTLKRERSSDEYVEALEVCHRSSLRLGQLVERLVTFARGQNGGESKSHRVNIGQLVSEAVAMIQPWAKSRGIRIESTAADQRVHGDPVQLSQLVTNLIANAVDHNKNDGMVTVSVTQQASSVTFNVTDNGPGIPVEFQTRIFEPFYQLDQTRELRKGVGMGLSICKSVVDAHKGQLSLQSRVGAGTTVCVSLPNTQQDSAEDR